MAEYLFGYDVAPYTGAWIETGGEKIIPLSPK